MKLPMVLVGIIVISGLLISNIIFLNKLEEVNKSQDFYKMKFEALQGDVDVLTYDLITSRDSVRILHQELERCLQQQATLPENATYVR